MTGRSGALLRQALAYAGRGGLGMRMGIFPLHYVVEHEGQLRCSCGNLHAADNNAAKHPYGRLAPNGLLNATGCIETIRRWWGAGVPYNIGLRTGAASGIVVIDVDPRHGGDETLAELERRFGALCRTWRFLTGGGGEHILFRHPGRPVKTTSAIGQGIDVRGDGGYIVAPPSRHISGRYYALDVDHHPDEVPLADMPRWLLALVGARPRQKVFAALPETWRELVANGVDEGQRNIAVTRLTGHLLRKNVDPHVVLDVVRCWNALRCRPPLGDDEILRTVDSICGLELARLRRTNGQ